MVATSARSSAMHGGAEVAPHSATPGSYRDEMPLQNRMTPFGEPIAVASRGLVYGNRGCMHDAHGRIRRPFGVKRWIACRLEFRGWHRAPLLQPGRFTELFFLDEATAFAAGHRPCRLCRYDDYEAFVDAWTSIHRRAATNADAIDAVLHRRAVGSRAAGDSGIIARRSTTCPMACSSGRRRPGLVLGPALLRWTPAGYTAATPRRRGVRRPSSRRRRWCGSLATDSARRWSRSCTLRRSS